MLVILLYIRIEKKVLVVLAGSYALTLLLRLNFDLRVNNMAESVISDLDDQIRSAPR